MFLDIFFGSGVTYQSLANGSVFHSGFPTKKVLLTNFADNSKINNIEKLPFIKIMILEIDRVAWVYSALNANMDLLAQKMGGCALNVKME